MMSAKTRGTKIQDRYIQTSKLCSLMETKQLLSFILVGDFNAITLHYFLKKIFQVTVILLDLLKHVKWLTVDCN